MNLKSSFWVVNPQDSEVLLGSSVRKYSKLVNQRNFNERPKCRPVQFATSSITVTNCSGFLVIWAQLSGRLLRPVHRQLVIGFEDLKNLLSRITWDKLYISFDRLKTHWDSVPVKFDHGHAENSEPRRLIEVSLLVTITMNQIYIACAMCTCCQ